MLFGAITVGNNASFLEKLDWIRRTGMTAWQPSAPEFSASNEPPARVREMAAERSITLSALAAGVPMSDPAKREQCLSDWQKNVSLARQLGVSIMFSRSFPLPEGASPKDAWSNCVFLCKEMTRVCSDNGVQFAFETDHENFIDTLPGLLRLLNEVDSPEMKVNFDPCNFYIGGNSPTEVLDALFDRVVHAHIKDAVREGGQAHEVPVGQGDLKYDEIFADLQKRGYDGAMVIEHCTTFEQLQSAWDHIRPYAEALRK